MFCSIGTSLPSVKVNQIKENDFARGNRRRRLHELVVALIKQQEGFDLLDAEAPQLEGPINSLEAKDPARWLDRNRRVLSRYQAVVRSAVTLDALLDEEN